MSGRDGNEEDHDMTIMTDYMMVTMVSKSREIFTIKGGYLESKIKFSNPQISKSLILKCKPSSPS